MPYKAFLSYSRAADGKLAPAIQLGLHRFGRSWYQGQAVRVFRDQTNLSANPGLWSSIEAALADSEYFILLISPQAAVSKWISKEVEYWISHRSGEKMLLVLTEGNIVWDAEHGDFDWTVTTLPTTLKNVYREEPNWVDLRWIRDRETLSLQDPRFRDKIADISAALLRRPKDQLVGEDVRQQRRARQLTVSAVLALTLLTLVSIATAIWANQERHLAIARQLAAQSELLSNRDQAWQLRALLAIESLRMATSVDGRIAVREAIAQLPHVLFSLPCNGPALAVAFSHDGSQIATGCKDGSAHIFEGRTGKELASVKSGHEVRALAFSLDGRLLAVGSAAPSEETLGGQESRVSIVDANSGKITADFTLTPSEAAAAAHVDEPAVLAFSPSGWLAIGSAGYLKSIGTVRLVEPGTWKVALRAEFGMGIQDLAFSPDGQSLAIASGEILASDGEFRVMDPHTGALLLSEDKNTDVASATYSPDGRWIAIAKMDHRGKQLDNAVEVRKVPGHESVWRSTFDLPVLTARFAANGQYLIASTSAVAKVISTQSWKEISTIRHGTTATAIAISADGSRLAVANEYGVSVIEVSMFDSSGRQEFGQEIRSFAFSAQHEWMLIGSGHMLRGRGGSHLLNLRSGQEVWRTERGPAVTAVAFSPNGAWVAIGTGSVFPETGTTSLVAVQNGEAVFEKKLDGNGVAFSPDGRSLAVGSYGAVHVLDVPSGPEQLQINFQKPSQWPEFRDVSVRTVAFSPDGNRIAAGGGDRVRIYDSSGKQLTEMPHPAEVNLVQFHPNGLWLATGCNDKFVRFMDVRTGVPLWRLSLETVPSTLTFSKDGHKITIGTADGDIRVYDVFSHDELAQTWRPGNILALAYSDDNKRLLEGFAENEKIAAWGSEFISISDVLSDACSHVTANFSKEDWRRYFGNERYRKTCPGAP